MRIRLVAAMIGALVALTFGTAAASAQEDYPGGTTDQRVDASEADRPEVLGTTQSRPAAVSSADDSVLPVTGGDLIGLVVVGAGLIGVGTFVVRRSRRTATAA